MFERVALAGGELTNRLHLAVAVAVESDLAGVAPVLDNHPGGHGVGGAQRPRDRRDDLLARCRNDDDVSATDLVVGDQVGGLREHEWVDDVVQGLADDRLHLLDVPPRAHIGDIGPHSVHLVVIGTRHQEQELRVGRLENRAPID